jgi:hypothetical protein
VSGDRDILATIEEGLDGARLERPREEVALAAIGT